MHKIIAARAATAVLVGSVLTALAVTAPAQAAEPDLRLSNSSARSDAKTLDGSQVSGPAYVFWAGDSAASVEFLLDPEGSPLTSSVDVTELIAPYDLGRTAVDGRAKPFDTDNLSAGSHRLAAVVTDTSGSRSTHWATFTVDPQTATLTSPAPPPATVKPGGSTLISADFDSESPGPVSPVSFNSAVGPTNTDSGAFAGMTYAADSRGSGKVVRTALRAGTWLGGGGPDDGNVLMVSLPKVSDRVCMAYDVRFSSGFDFSAGGKLPGPVGVAPGTPPSTPEGGGLTAHGWSGRLMWLGPAAYGFAGENGNSNMAVTYLYHPGQSSQWGDNVQWHEPFVAGTWHHVQQCHVMNTVGRADGVLQAWLDGAQVVDQRDVVYRSDPAVHITHFDWSIFRGGEGSLWAGKTDGYVDMDNLVVTAE